MSEHGYRVIYEPLAEGEFQVIVPALPGIVTFGRTIEELARWHKTPSHATCKVC